MSVVIASTSSALIPAIISAVASLLAACIVGLVAFRAQRAEELLESIRRIVEDGGHEVVRSVKEDLRDVIGTHPAKRRWYE